MEITQLHYFKTAARYENFTRASQELHITQSALSRSISSLEEEIGFPLFERKRGGKITLNPQGRFFLKYVTNILNSLENAVDAIQEMTGLENGSIKIGVSESIFLKQVFYSFLCRHPNVRLSCTLQSPEQMKESLLDGTIHFAITKAPIDHADLVWTPLYEDRVTVMLPPGHPLEGRKSIALSELKNEHFIISNLGYDMESEFITLCHHCGFAPYVVYEGSGEDLTGLLVTAGLGIMLAPYSVSVGLLELLQLRDGIKENQNVPGIPLSDPFSRSRIGIVMKREPFLSMAAKELYQDITSYYQNLAPCPDQVQN